MATTGSRFRTKFVLVAGVGLVIGLTLAALASLKGIRVLGGDASEEIRKGLERASREYLTNHIEDTAQRVEFLRGRARAELGVLAAVTQTLIDRQADLAPLTAAAAAAGPLRDALVYDPRGDWSQTEAGEPSAVAVWGYLHAPADPKQPGLRDIKPEVRAAVEQTALLDLLLPALLQYGAEKQAMYFIGPEGAEYLRIAPYADAAGHADQLYPGHNKSPFWSFYFPGIVDGWRRWLADPARMRDPAAQVTGTAPYTDAGGSGAIMTMFQPLWDASRARFAGAVGVDVTLGQLIRYVQDLELAGSGFAFLAQENGNVFAVNADGQEILGLQQASGSSGAGVDIFQQFLHQSRDPAIQALALPSGDTVDYRDPVAIGGKDYVVVLKRLDPFNVWSGSTDIVPERWTLGFVVPAAEIYASLHKAQDTIAASSRGILISQIVITLVALAVVMFGILLVSRRMTGALVDLAAGAGKIAQKDYDVRVDVRSDDEFGALGRAFNQMAAEIRAYTHDLERLVEQRTAELQRASREIMALNERLKQENLRLGAELDVARRLQLMVLPQERELAELEGLDVAGYMRPADEVGGDYYDVLRAGDGVKIGIGDVTGHGLESGVLMLMIQTAVRTLQAAEERDAERFLNIVNKVLYQNIQRVGLDRTATLVLLDYAQGVLRLTGQHEEAVVVRRGGSIERIDTVDLGMPVGLEVDIAAFIARTELRLSPGDVVVLYTDGITEAEDIHGELYGIDRLCEVVRRVHERPAAEIKQAIVDDVMRFIGAQKVFDDITTVVIKRR
ncbi:SpoIIE family protein phosphatase [Nannocystis sp. ILAH1]|uniref:SpoIIE family protein phosphatase n=1 Tax=Nannocystis sp. ILAH1 TaxID=2996789 RepID=UPI00227051AD|nr:SpoIIE family protein phosphatase [Nannocystis sp. ILAH1]MCY0992453.1 SpoIIE family protein phosphatase [Nannocystis sp. ILAH1]